jgi:hypothetical protein
MDNFNLTEPVKMSMSAKDRLTLQQNYKRLIEVNYSVISAHLISSLTIDLEMHADIEACPTERKKMEKLLYILPSRGGHAMREFINAVRPNYNWIASKLEEDGVVPDLNFNSTTNALNCNNILSRSSSTGSQGSKFENLKDLSISAHIRPIQKIMQKSITVCKNWYLLAHTLGLDANVLTDIQREMVTNGGTNYAIHSSLMSWLSKCGPSKATFGHLIQLLEGEGVNEVTEGLLDLWTSLQQ